MRGFKNLYQAKKVVLFGKVLWWDLQVNYVNVARLKPDREGNPVLCEKCTKLRLNPDLVKEACEAARASV